MMARFKLLLSLALLYCLFPLAAFASDCTEDPNECTLKKLCEVATALDGDTIIWSTLSSSAKHVTVAKTLGMECGVTPIVDLCETDPNECKVSEICTKATTVSAGQISWDNSASGHVALAKEYGLQCDVVEEVVVQQIADDNQQGCSKLAPEACTDIKLCEIATWRASGLVGWNNMTLTREAVKEAKKRGLACGVDVAVKKTCSVSNIEGCTNTQLCRKTTEPDGKTWKWNTYSSVFKSEAKKRGLTCDVGAEVAKMRCSLPAQIACTNEKILCTFATFTTTPTLRSSGTVEWELTEYYKPYVVEAKDRGITCRVGEAKTINFKQAKTINFKQAFTSRPKITRQKLQYALKKLGYYSYGIDGLWGKGTSSGFDTFVRNKKPPFEAQTAYQVFDYLLSKVAVPSSFAPPKPKSVPRSSNANGLKSITSNPSIAADQAYAVCLPLAQQAKSQASNQPKQVLRPSPYSTTCKQNYAGNFDCSSRRASGGFWGGVADGVASSSAGRGAYNAVLDSCLAQYGWRKP